jgi:DNA-binding LacI/PurR family transcriptional regulator
MLDRRVDGLILAAGRRTDPSIAELAQRDIPVVLCEEGVRGDGGRLPGLGLQDRWDGIG